MIIALYLLALLTVLAGTYWTTVTVIGLTARRRARNAEMSVAPDRQES